MKAAISTKSGHLEIAADETGVVPGVVRVKLGEGLLSVTLFLSPEEAMEIGMTASAAARIASDAKKAEARRA